MSYSYDTATAQTYVAAAGRSPSAVAEDRNVNPVTRSTVKLTGGGHPPGVAEDRNWTNFGKGQPETLLAVAAGGGRGSQLRQIIGISTRYITGGRRPWRPRIATTPA